MGGNFCLVILGSLAGKEDPEKPLRKTCKANPNLIIPNLTILNRTHYLLFLPFFAREKINNNQEEISEILPIKQFSFGKL
jgi:hypothetical protein